ncbi:MAG TPA: hypothetical protein VMV37_15540, partial [Gammaproteobacteria bacterium]|nr:hypothetical protein [Gammaproteobacteria bacterium]
VLALLVSSVCLGISFYDALASDRFVDTTVAGVGVLFGALAVFLVMTGIIAELVYKTSEYRLEHVAVPASVENRLVGD